MTLWQNMIFSFYNYNLKCNNIIVNNQKMIKMKMIKLKLRKQKILKQIIQLKKKIKKKIQFKQLNNKFKTMKIYYKVLQIIY